VKGIKRLPSPTVTMLLYPGRWFPMSASTRTLYAELHIRVPRTKTVIASGAARHKSLAANRTQFDFNWTKTGFPAR